MHRVDEPLDGLHLFLWPFFGSTSILEDEDGKVTVVVVLLYGTH